MEKAKTYGERSIEFAGAMTLLCFALLLGLLRGAGLSWIGLGIVSAGAGLMLAACFLAERIFTKGK
jgi:hypothetical protein